MKDLDNYLSGLGMSVVESKYEHIPDKFIECDLYYDRIMSDEHESNTLLKGDTPVGMAGYQKVNDWTAEVWSHLIDHKYGKTFFKCVKHYVENIYVHKFERLQAVVHENDHVSQRFDERLGFVKEAVMKRHYKGDQILYRRLS